MKINKMLTVILIVLILLTAINYLGMDSAKSYSSTEVKIFKNPTSHEIIGWFSSNNVNVKSMTYSPSAGLVVAYN